MADRHPGSTGRRSASCSRTAETWAVVGLSGNPHRTAYRIARFLQEHGKRIVPIHPDAPTVLGEQGYATLADVPFAIDVVDVFRRSDAAGQFADEAVAVGRRACGSSSAWSTTTRSRGPPRPASRW